MIPDGLTASAKNVGITRMRGGDPELVTVMGDDGPVLPACAGVILGYHFISSCFWSITRMRGGDPGKEIFEGDIVKYYPHARG